MPKIPQVTIGRATGEGAPSAPTTPNVTFGRATGQGNPPTEKPTTKLLTLDQAVEGTYANAPTLKIEELTGPKRRVSLRGRALPFRPGSMRFVSEQRIDNTAYTGFPRYNQTVLGAQENDTEMSGAWHDRYLREGPINGYAIADVTALVDSPPSASGAADSETIDIRVQQRVLDSVQDLVDLFVDITYSGRPLRVSWMREVRTGRLAKFERDWQNEHDVTWKMTFMWIGRDEDLGRPSPARSSLVGLAKALSTGYTGMQTATGFDDVAGLRPSFADRVDAAVGRAQRSIQDISSAVQTRLSSVTDSLDAVRRAVTLAAEVRDQAQDVIDTLNETVASAMLVAVLPRQVEATARQAASFEPEQLESLVDLNPGTAITAACQQYGAIRAARALKHIAARQRFQALRSTESEVIAIVQIREGQDLRDVAARWYGTPDAWDAIRRFNGLSSSSATPGTIIFVPAQGSP